MSIRTIPALPKESWLYVLLVAVLLSRVPFLGAGYGLHWDAWGNATIAQQIAESGRYTMARVPGAPVYELLTACLVSGGRWALNGLSALAGTGCVAIMALLARKAGCRDWLLATAALAFCPVFYISSVTSKDFTLACAFLLLSTLFITKNSPLSAGVALGVAMGCRLTSGALALPLALALFSLAPCVGRFGQVVRFAVAATATALVAFIPAFARYGLSFLTFYDPVYYPDLAVVASRGTLEVWGLFGSIALVLALLGALCLRRPPSSTNSAAANAQTLPWIAVVLIYAALYIAFPDPAAYFLPAVPFTILLLARFTSRRLFQVFCIATVVSSFVTWENKWPAKGAIFHDRAERLRMITNIENFYSYARSIPGRNVFVIGGFYHAIGLIAPESKQSHFVYLLTEKQLSEFLRDGYTVYYLPAIREFEHDVYGIDLARYGAIDVYGFREAQRLDKLQHDVSQSAVPQ